MTAIVNFVPPNLDVSSSGPGLSRSGGAERGQSAADRSPDKVTDTGGRQGGGEFARLMKSETTGNNPVKNGTVGDDTVKKEATGTDPADRAPHADAAPGQQSKSATADESARDTARVLTPGAVDDGRGTAQAADSGTSNKSATVAGTDTRSTSRLQTAANLNGPELTAGATAQSRDSVYGGEPSSSDRTLAQSTDSTQATALKPGGLPTDAAASRHSAAAQQPVNNSGAPQGSSQIESGSQELAAGNSRPGGSTSTASGPGTSRIDSPGTGQHRNAQSGEPDSRLSAAQAASSSDSVTKSGAESQADLRSNTSAQARQAAPVQSDRLPTSISLNAERGDSLPAGRVVSGGPGSNEQLAGLELRGRYPNEAGSSPGSRSTGVAAGTDITAPDGQGMNTPPTGKDLPASGKALPGVLTQTPAVNAPGLADRIEQMLRAGGSERRRLGRGSEEIGKIRSAADAPGEIPGMDRSAISQNRVSGAEFFSKVFAQGNGAGGNIDLAPGPQSGHNSQLTQSPQNAASDSQTASLLSQSLSGTDRASTGRLFGAAGLDNGNGLTLNLQQASQEIGSQLSSRIRWMSNLNISSAELKLHPAELGTLEILISAEDDQTRVNFITSNAAAKELIESSMPRLRELLGQNGLLLEQGDVSHRDLERNGSGSGNQPTGSASQLANAAESEAVEQQPLYRRAASENQIDHFA